MVVDSVNGMRVAGSWEQERGDHRTSALKMERADLHATAWAGRRTRPSLLPRPGENSSTVVWVQEPKRLLGPRDKNLENILIFWLKPRRVTQEKQRTNYH